MKLATVMMEVKPTPKGGLMVKAAIGDYGRMFCGYAFEKLFGIELRDGQKLWAVVHTEPHPDRVLVRHWGPDSTPGRHQGRTWALVHDEAGVWVLYPDDLPPRVAEALKPKNAQVYVELWEEA